MSDLWKTYIARIFQKLDLPTCRPAPRAVA